MNKISVLVIEDDVAINNLIKTTLETRDYKYFSAYNGLDGILIATSQNPDIILLDLGLPDIDGNEIIKKIRSYSNTPIIVISARSEDKDKVEALDNGADDYLTKPFSVDELLARIRSTSRRLMYMNTVPFQTNLFENGELKIDFASGVVYFQEEEIHLTPIEYKLLCLLARNVGKVLTYTFITKEIWGSSWDNDVASLRVFMATLRKKIEKNGTSYIQTHVGVGYRMIRI
ncbi:MAG: response regulator transcription factor [Bacillota bacterium]|nr:response regulator transcription factor [Bacillota bacterium]